MSDFKKINPSDINESIFDLIGKDWALVTSGNSDKFNTMTISWGGAGIMWGKPVAFTFIRPQRYTFEFIENNGYYTMSFLTKNTVTHSSFAVQRAAEILTKLPKQVLHLLLQRTVFHTLQRLNLYLYVKRCTHNF